MLEIVERCSTDRGEIQLQRRGEHYEIIYNGTFLMSTYNGESERLLVKAAMDRCDNVSSVLIGGLGVGFSLAESLLYPKVEKVDVVEIETVIIKWNKEHLKTFSSSALDDPRTHIINTDLIKWIYSTDNKYDVICLDIDNGPDWIVSNSNSNLYADHGINELVRLLNPGGVISFWSANESSDFLEKLKELFETVEVILIPQKLGEPDYVYLSKSPRANLAQSSTILP
ncbi:spermine/spermidine synthase [Paenibacillus monticola]|uniref:Spermine/spermidine synthase n=1 Tax=Paenibacillus monticola TaxID=2666075 RepID=A0A7X2L492_9BACL|nr:spermine/spermidine synthase [Paenibacillus monticola]MRN56110.1 spermine/spermidine synthase [Paenibacillus monticola]